MKKVMETADESGAMCSFFPRTALAVVLIVLLVPAVGAQVRQLIQIKTFDEQLQPVRNIDVAINDKAYVSSGNKGMVVVEMGDNELPVKTIRFKNDQLEAGAWNYSKGTLEIIVRKKSFKMISLLVRDNNRIPLRNLSVSFSGKKMTTITSGTDGTLELPMAPDDKITAADQFSVPGYNVVDMQLSDKGCVLTVSPIPQETSVSQTPPQTGTPHQDVLASGKPQAKDNLVTIDSITSIATFYGYYSRLAGKNIDAATKDRLDTKFGELVEHLRDSLRAKEDLFLAQISDTSFVSDDIRNLLRRAAQENQKLKLQRTDFDDKIKIIDRKLSKGITNLDENTRGRLLTDLKALEQLLTENESRFYKNQNDYRQIINSLKEKYFDIQKLENKLSESEARRLEEQEEFRKRLFAVSIVVITFIALTIKLVRVSIRLKKQKKELVSVNAEVKRINENLEAIVQDRTRLLEEANRELDTFLYRASHDMRSPVRSILGLCNIAIHLSDGEPRELIKRVAYTTEGMDTLLKKLSLISEINQPSGYSEIALRNMVDRVQQRLENFSSSLQVSVEADCSENLVFYSYPNLVEIIMMNLLENAIFYSTLRSPDNAQVKFKANRVGDTMEFSVSDNGIGLEDIVRERLFGMFFKGHVDSKGNGLGLYIVQKSVQALKGTISVDSQVGSYTRFVVRLPLHFID